MSRVSFVAGAISFVGLSPGVTGTKLGLEAVDVAGAGVVGGDSSWSETEPVASRGKGRITSGMIAKYSRRNRLFLRVTRPEWNILTRYCRYGNTSTTLPVRSHFLFSPCTTTLVPRGRGWSSHALTFWFLIRRWLRLLRAFSRSSAVRTHSL